MIQFSKVLKAKSLSTAWQQLITNFETEIIKIFQIATLSSVLKEVIDDIKSFLLT